MFLTWIFFAQTPCSFNQSWFCSSEIKALHTMRQKSISLSLCGLLTITEHLVEIEPLTGQEINTGTLKRQRQCSIFTSWKKKKNKTTNSQASQLLLNNLKILSLSIVNDQRPRAVTLTYLTNELYVRGRPVERFRENIKIKRFYNIPAEKGMQKTN